MISFQKRFLFVHIPKTAGNSVQSVLQHYSEDELVRMRPQQDGIERFGLRNPDYPINKHSTLAEYRAALGEQKLAQLYKFTCVRNPWDRMISAYFTPGQGATGWDLNKFRTLVIKTLSITDYLRIRENDSKPFANIDAVMRFETLEKDFAEVCARLALPAVPLPKYNRSPRGHYRDYYDDESRQLVAERFVEEIAHFGYSF